MFLLHLCNSLLRDLISLWLGLLHRWINQGLVPCVLTAGQCHLHGNLHFVVVKILGIECPKVLTLALQEHVLLYSQDQGKTWKILDSFKHPTWMPGGSEEKPNLPGQWECVKSTSASLGFPKNLVISAGKSGNSSPLSFKSQFSSKFLACPNR